MFNPEFQAQERKAASKARSSLNVSLRTSIKRKFKSRSGKMEKSNITSRFRDGRLDRLVLNSPHYSFKAHFGSSLSGRTNETDRSATNVQSFIRKIKSKSIAVQAHSRRATRVAAHNKGINYKAYNHIADALKSSNALEQLATDLGTNRIVQIASQIDFQ